MNNIFVPEKSTRLLRLYHSSSLGIVPFMVLGAAAYKYDVKPWDGVIGALNVINFGFHSYVSASCVITDYVKPKLPAKGLRVASLGLHGSAMYGYIQTILFAGKEYEK